MIFLMVFTCFHEIVAPGDNNCDCCTSMANSAGDSGWGINVYRMRDVNAFSYYIRTCTESRQCLKRLFLDMKLHKNKRVEHSQKVN